ncbi:MAG: helicase-associated domain-containing protein [Planctomycetota bacterium]|nr:helicase-associated domain-containing protein [Planctomycetota bacterium]
MNTRSDRPLIVQSDRSLLLEVGGEAYAAARDAIAPFCELVKSPEHIHTYALTALSVWNAAAAGLAVETMVEALTGFSRYEVPANVLRDIRDLHGRYGRLRLRREEGARDLYLEADDESLLDQVSHSALTRDLVGERVNGSLPVEVAQRGEIKRALIKLGWPVEDLAGYVDGGPLEVALKRDWRDGERFSLRDYQHDAVETFHRGGTAHGGSGVVVLPCGAGKTVVGIGAMARIGRKTLILTTNHTAVRQWRRELLDKTELTEDDIGEYTGVVKEVRAVTISTYQILTYRRRKTEPFAHFELFSSNDWGLIIYDEVHMLPAPVFRATADIQATRRLGLTATLVREDGHEDDVFTLIGPKRFDVPWKVLERKGWIAEALCREIRVPLGPELRRHYVLADRRAQFRLASENAAKLDVLESILYAHRGDLVLVIGQYLDQLDRVAERLGAPLITGKTPKDERIERYAAFSSGDQPVLIVSKVGNFAVDLPEARVIVQLSGTFGSRQEEAQRLGRVLRPKADGRGARFYTLVSDETVEQDFAQHRQLFLTEQGYAYEILDAHAAVRACAEVGATRNGSD